MIEISILGCSGGLASGRHTTCFRVGDNVLIDAGSGLSGLSPSDLMKIDHVFLTHAHMDHISALPLLLDFSASFRKTAVTVHCLSETESILRKHVFNNLVWPDMTRPFRAGDNPILTISPFKLRDVIEIGPYQIRSCPAKHTVPTTGYRIDAFDSALLFTGDSAPCDEFWSDASKLKSCSGIISDISFPDKMEQLALKSGHMTTGLLRDMTAKYSITAPLYITHMKPGYEDDILSEIHAHFSDREVRILSDGIRLDF